MNEVEKCRQEFVLRRGGQDRRRNTSPETDPTTVDNKSASSVWSSLYGLWGSGQGGGRSRSPTDYCGTSRGQHLPKKRPTCTPQDNTIRKLFSQICCILFEKMNSKIIWNLSIEFARKTVQSPSTTTTRKSLKFQCHTNFSFAQPSCLTYEETGLEFENIRNSS